MKIFSDRFVNFILLFLPYLNDSIAKRNHLHLKYKKQQTFDDSLNQRREILDESSDFQLFNEEDLFEELTKSISTLDCLLLIFNKSIE